MFNSWVGCHLVFGEFHLSRQRYYHGFCVGVFYCARVIALHSSALLAIYFWCIFCVLWCYIVCWVIFCLFSLFYFVFI